MFVFFLIPENVLFQGTFNQGTATCAQTPSGGEKKNEKQIEGKKRGQEKEAGNRKKKNRMVIYFWLYFLVLHLPI